MIELIDVYKVYSVGTHEVPALRGVNLKIDEADSFSH